MLLWSLRTTSVLVWIQLQVVKMLNASNYLICSHQKYACQLLCYGILLLLWSLRTTSSWYFHYVSYIRYRPNWFPSFWTQLTYLLTGWAILTIYLAWHFGLDKPTSRCQSTDIMWTAYCYQPVIQGVAFICYIISKVTKLYSGMGSTLSNTTYNITSIAFGHSATTSVLNTGSLVTTSSIS